MVHQLGGLFVPAHADRAMNGLFAQLGFFPDDLEADAVEIWRRTSLEAARKEYPELRAHTLIQNSDAHFIEDIGRAGNRYAMESRNFSELAMALRGENGRSVFEL